MNQQEVEVVDYFADKKQDISLQDAFLAFRKQKMKNIQVVKQQNQPKHRSKEELQKLRNKFIQLVHKHEGIPYDRRKHPQTSDLFNKPYQLDCCALIRVAVKEMQDELGFKFGPWNQAFMYDTLPIRSTEYKNMRSGDLIFYQGRYYDESRRQQKHHMVHVEMYDPTPENPKRCFGSRWNDGVVSYFDSYEFKASTWELEQITFCNIDTWLDGVCCSVCPEHEWVIENTDVNKKSIFYDQQDYVGG